MRCSICGAYGASDDNFCRRCGASQRNSRLPVRRTPALPLPWRRAAPALAQGAALVAAGVAAEWLLRSAAKAAFQLPLSVLKPPKRSTSRALTRKREPSLPEGAVAVSETVVMRRVVLRR